VTRRACGSTPPSSGSGTSRPVATKKRQLLDEIVAVTGIHRKAAIRLLPRGPGRARPLAGRPRRYGPEVAVAASPVATSGRIGAHRLHPFVPELLDRSSYAPARR